jgi:hypothetical protein
MVVGGGPLRPDARLEQRAKGILGTSRKRSQRVTAVEEPRSMAFAGPLGNSAGRWGMELEPGRRGGPAVARISQIWGMTHLGTYQEKGDLR